ncbi:MAG: glycogen synthase [Spirochaetes bacterium]|nr:glycogen synthase [Spirochaetota bacterium]
MNIVFCTSEAYPFAKTGGLADYSYSLPKALAKRGHNVYLFLPRYYCVDKNKFQCKLTGMPLPVPIGNGIRWAGIYYTNYLEGIHTYFIEHDDYYGRDGLYDYNGTPYNDNAERFIYFCRACIEALKQLAIAPEIIHCNDWQTACIPLFLKTHYAHDNVLKNAKSILTVHNVGYQGVFGKDVLWLMQLTEEFFTPENVEFFGNVNLLKAGVVNADCLVTVSKKYAQEIQEPEYGWDLAPIFKKHANKLFGILNGVDYEHWNPEKDKYIPYQYSINNHNSGKKKCKKELQKFMKLKVNEVPVLGCISRLTYQKGIDILIDTLDWLFFDEQEVQFVILGSGEQWIIDRFEWLHAMYPERVGIWWGYNEQLAHLIEAGSDFYIMPSRYEPSGLNQMYSLAYGTIPIVRATGGLDDSIKHFDVQSKTGNGFKYQHNDIGELYTIIRYALRIYKNQSMMKILIHNAMSFKRSWDDTAREYEELYNNITKCDD